MGQRTFIILKKNYKNSNGEWASRVSFIHHQWGLGRVMPALFMQEVLKTTYNLDRSMSYLSLETAPMPNDDGYLTQPISMFYTFRPLNSPTHNYGFYNNDPKKLGLLTTNQKTVIFYEADGKTLRTESKDDPTTVFEYPMEYTYDIFDISNIREYFELSDNNNGCMIVEVTQQYNKDGTAKCIISEAFKVRIGFCTGSEEEDFYYVLNNNSDSVLVNYNPKFTTLVSPEFYTSETWNHKGTSAFSKSFKTIVGQLADIEYVYDRKREKELVKLRKDLLNICTILDNKGYKAFQIQEELDKIMNKKNSNYS